MNSKILIIQLVNNQACNYDNCWRLASILQQSDRISGELLKYREGNDKLMNGLVRLILLDNVLQCFLKAKGLKG